MQLTEEEYNNLKVQFRISSQMANHYLSSYLIFLILLLQEKQIKENSHAECIINLKLSIKNA